MRAHAFFLQRGFTLVEAIIVIVITGVITAVVAVFIRTPVQGYFDSVARADLTDVADTALRRMARELRLALPNSIRVANSGTDTYLEFLLTNDGGRYLAVEDNPAAGNNFLDFDNAANLTFDVAGMAMPNIARGNSIVVYNLGIDPVNAYCPSTTGCGNRAVVDQVATVGNLTTVRLFANPFPGAMRSPTNRFQVVTTPVTYACVGRSLVRYAGYAIQGSQPTSVAQPPLSNAPSRAVLASGATCTFSYDNATTTRSALVGLGIALTGSGNAGAVQLFHQIHVDNTP